MVRYELRKKKGNSGCFCSWALKHKGREFLETEEENPLDEKTTPPRNLNPAYDLERGKHYL